MNTEYYLPEERKEEMDRSAATLPGRMVDTLRGTAVPVAVMMSNDKEARPQYGINRRGWSMRRRWREA